MTDLILSPLSSLIGSGFIASCILFAVGLVLLIFGGNWFVDGAVNIAKRFGLPEILIGATIVSIGTTLPEVTVSATAALAGSGSIAYGNAIGSVICNTALICAMTVAIRPAPVDKKSLKIPTFFFFGSSVLYLIFAYFFRRFSRVAGILLLLIFILYMTVNIRNAVKFPRSNDTSGEDVPEMGPAKAVILLIIGAVLIAVGSDFLVNNGTVIAREAGVPESVIALTFVALGTSLPELVTAVTSLIKGHGALSLGNIIGANLIDLVLVSGLAPLLAPFNLPCEKTVFGMNASLLVDLPVMVTVMAILTVPPLLKGKLSRWQGIVLLLIYAGFCTVQFAI